MASIFTQIIRRELPGEIVYEDGHSIAFLDIHPKSTGHTLVVPKVEVASYHDLPDAQIGPYMEAVKQVAAAVTRAVGTPYYNLVLNNGAPAGQVIFHVHFHIIPRFAGGETPALERTQFAQVGAAIRAALAG